MWATVQNPKNYAHKLCRSLGREIFNPKEIVEFLRTVDCLELVKKQEEIRTKEVLLFFTLADFSYLLTQKQLSQKKLFKTIYIVIEALEWT